MNIKLKINRKTEKIYAIVNDTRYPFWVPEDFEFFKGWQSKGIFADGEWGRYVTIDDCDDYTPEYEDEEEE